MKKLFTLLIVCSIPFLAFAEFDEKPASVDPGSVAGKVDKAGDSMTGRLNITAADFLVDLENNTDAVSNEILRAYSNRATPTDGDEGYFSLRLNDDGSTETEFIRETWKALDTDGKSKDSSWQISGFRGNVFGSFLLLDGETNRATFGGSTIADTYLFSDDPEFNSGIRGIVDDNVRVFVGGVDRVVHSDTVSDFREQVGVGAGASFNPLFKVVSTTLSSHPCPSMTSTQKDAIATPEAGDCIRNTTLGETQEFDGATWQTMYRQNGAVVAIGDGGTGASSKGSAFNALAPTTTKGDLIARSTTNARLPIGTDGQVLTADSVEVLGMKWTSSLAPTIKAGSVAGASFAGNPKIFTVTFNTAFPDANYALSYLGEVDRGWVFSTKLAGSFIIDTGSNTQPTGDIDWTATAHNDP